LPFGNISFDDYLSPDHRRFAAMTILSQPKSDISDFGQVKMPELG
jgi:hypothetical protein